MTAAEFFQIPFIVLALVITVMGSSRLKKRLKKLAFQKGQD